MAVLIIASATGPTPRGFAPGTPAAPQLARTTIQLASSSAILPDNGDNDVHGRITDPDGKPIAGAQVDFDAWPITIGEHRQTKSKSDGTYDISNLPDGNYHVKAAKGSVSLITAGGNVALITVPPDRTVDFKAPKT